MEFIGIKLWCHDACFLFHYKFIALDLKHIIEPSYQTLSVSFELFFFLEGGGGGGGGRFYFQLIISQ